MWWLWQVSDAPIYTGDENMSFEECKKCQGCPHYVLLKNPETDETDGHRCMTYPKCHRKLTKKALIDDTETASAIIFLTEKLGGIDGKLSVLLSTLDDIEAKLDNLTQIE